MRLANGETGEIIGPALLTLRMDNAQSERVVDYERDNWWQLQPDRAALHTAA